MNTCKLSFFHLIIWVRYHLTFVTIVVHLTAQFFIFNNLFCLLIFLIFNKHFLIYFIIDFDGYYIVRTDQNIFSINVELTSTFLLYRGLVHLHHRIWKFSVVMRFEISLFFNISLKRILPGSLFSPPLKEFLIKNCNTVSGRYKN